MTSQDEEDDESQFKRTLLEELGRATGDSVVSSYEEEKLHLAKDEDQKSIESISLSDGCNNESKMDQQQHHHQPDEGVDATLNTANLNTTFDVLPDQRSTHSPQPATTNDRTENPAYRSVGTTEKYNEQDGANDHHQQQELALQREQIQLLVQQARRQSDKIGELEGALINTSRTCHQLESMLKKELNRRSALESDNLNLISEICKLRLKLNSSEQLKKRDDEKINLLNATLMERETEISILKLQLTRAQTSNVPATTNNNNSSASYVIMQPEQRSSNMPTQPSSLSYTNQVQQQQQHQQQHQPRLRPPSQTYSISRFDNHQIIHPTGSLQRNYTVQQQPSSSDDHQLQYEGINSQQQIGPGFASHHSSSLYSSPKNMPTSVIPIPSANSSTNITVPIYGNITSPYRATTSGSSQPPSVSPLDRSDRRYRTLPRNMPSTIDQSTNNFYQHQQSLAIVNNRVYEPSQFNYHQHQYNKQRSYSTDDSLCTVTNLDDSNESGQTTNLMSNNTNNMLPSQDNKIITISSDDNAAYDNIPPLTSTTKSNQPLVDDSHYATIDRFGGVEQSGANSLVKHSENVQPVAESCNVTAPQHKLPSVPRQTSGLRRIFNKFRRAGSNSNNLEDTDDIILAINHNSNKNNNFMRGGTRSTTGGAYQTSSSSKDQQQQQHNTKMMMVNRPRTEPSQITKPFGEWDTIMIADWLTTIGLSMYSNQCKRWAKNGSHIMNATSSEVERGLGISNTLHRKKLRLAISELNGDCDKVTKAAANLDYLWVARWLDDIGLPQYKEQFINNRIDGRVLNYLTVEDLVSINITSLLHHASIRCGIRVLRSINFDLQALKRRATSDEIDGMMQWSNWNQQQSSSRASTLTRGGQTANTQPNTYDSGSQSILNNGEADQGEAALGRTGIGSGVSAVSSRMPTQPDIALWSCHRVMEWLRLIDFAEFAPNLRGSGVHGGLIIYEDGFNADLMSSLLSIPDDKTLLRRHIYSLFKELIGMELFQQKRQYESHPHYTPLTPTAELKPAKKSQFSLLRRSRSKVGQDTTIEEYLCPMYPIDSCFMKHAAANAARDALKDQQQHQQQQQQQQHQDHDQSKAGQSIYANNQSDHQDQELSPESTNV